MTTKKSTKGDPNTKRRNPVVPRKTLKYTYQEVKAALIANMGMKYETAHQLNINPATMFNYIKKWPRLEKYVAWGQKKQKEILERKLYEIAAAETLDGNKLEIERRDQLKALIFWLSRRGGEEWKQVKVIKDEREGNKDIPVPTAISLEEKTKILEGIRQKQIGINISITQQSDLEPILALESKPQPILPVNGVVLENTPLLEKKEKETDFAI